MKHGPIALITEEVPVVVVATQGHTYEKVVSNIQEVRARGAEVIVVATHGDDEIRRTPSTSCTCRPRDRVALGHPGNRPAPAALVLHRQGAGMQRGPAT
jgi:fructoselysine-6-P-deglycase FrlB-like protein